MTSLKVPAVRASFEAALGLLAASEESLSLIERWLGQAHVAKWWDPPEIGIASIKDHLSEAHVAPYLILEWGRPVGYLQLYHANPDPFWQKQPLPAETFGLDLFLGEPDALGRGVGTRAIRLALGHLRRQPGVARIHVDPAPDNARAIRTFARCGFRSVGLIQTPDEPSAYMILEPASPGRT